MLELKYKNWNEINLGLFSEIEGIAKSDMNDVDKTTYFLALLTETDVKTIEGLEIAEYGKLVDEINFINSMPKVEIKSEYVINGKEYELCCNMQNITVAQYIDFQNLYKDIENNKSALMAVFLVPKGKKYGEYDINEVKREIENHMSICDVSACMLFFSLLYRGLTIATLQYSLRMMKKEMRREKNKEIKEKMKMAIAEVEKTIHLMKNMVG